MKSVLLQPVSQTIALFLPANLRVRQISEVRWITNILVCGFCYGGETRQKRL